MPATQPSANRPLWVRLRGAAIVAWICIVLFLSFSIAAFMAGQYGASASFWIFIALGIHILLSSGRFEFDEDGVHHCNALAHHHMFWCDIRRVEVGVQGSLVLHGEGKRFVLAPVSTWPGPDGDAAQALLRRKMHALGLTPQASALADFKTHRNVRARPGDA